MNSSETPDSSKLTDEEKEWVEKELSSLFNIAGKRTLEEIALKFRDVKVFKDEESE